MRWTARAARRGITSLLLVALVAALSLAVAWGASRSLWTPDRGPLTTEASGGVEHAATPDPTATPDPAATPYPTATPDPAVLPTLAARSLPAFVDPSGRRARLLSVALAACLVLLAGVCFASRGRSWVRTVERSRPFAQVRLPLRRGPPLSLA